MPFKDSGDVLEIKFLSFSQDFVDEFPEDDERGAGLKLLSAVEKRPTCLYAVIDVVPQGAPQDVRV